jgi:hypothetical protein
MWTLRIVLFSKTNTFKAIHSQSWTETSTSWWPKKELKKIERMNEKRKVQLENIKKGRR